MGILVTEKMSKSFGGVNALIDLDMEIKEGSVHGLIGPNGSGKTTFYNVVTGVFPPTSGKVFFDGKDISNLPAYDIAKLGISRTFQTPKIMPRMTVLQNAMAGLYSNTKNDLLGTFFHIPFKKSKQEKQIEEKVMEYLEFVGLENSYNRC